jgi:hypothetical protein
MRWDRIQVRVQGAGDIAVHFKPHPVGDAIDDFRSIP